MYRNMKGSTRVLASPEIAVVVMPLKERCLGSPDTGRGVLYRCSTMASYVTGRVVAINGGYLVRSDEQQLGRQKRRRSVGELKCR